MSAKQAIKAYCRWCCCGSDSEVTACVVKDCALYPFRKGLTIKGKSKQGAVKARCHECFNSIQSSKCTQADCALWPYRDGHRPTEETIAAVQKVTHRRILKVRASG